MDKSFSHIRYLVAYYLYTLSFPSISRFLRSSGHFFQPTYVGLCLPIHHTIHYFPFFAKMASIHSIFCPRLVLALTLLLSVLNLVIAIPHNTHGSLHRDTGSWLREQARKVEHAKRDGKCPNLPAPLDAWADYSVKIRGKEPIDTACSTPSLPSLSGLHKRDYTCDSQNPCSNGKLSIIHS